MSKQLMAECLEEATSIFLAWIANQDRGLPSMAESFMPIATIAAALFDQRCKQADVWMGEEEFRRAYPWRYPVSSGVQTAKPMVCPDCSLLWTSGHVCPAAGSRGTARWPAS